MEHTPNSLSPHTWRSHRLSWCWAGLMPVKSSCSSTPFSWSWFHSHQWYCNFLIRLLISHKSIFFTNIIVKSVFLWENGARNSSSTILLVMPLRQDLLKFFDPNNFTARFIYICKKFPTHMTCYLAVDHGKRGKDFQFVVQNPKTFVVILKNSHKCVIQKKSR